MFSVISKLNSSNNCVHLLFIRLRIIIIIIVITIKNKQFFPYKTLGSKNTPKPLFTNLVYFVKLNFV
jgi:hypothetical protein